ncbi:MAG: Deoxyribodipyrimidine photo-lyase [Candidatus Thorarchaeota archaeon]|nr:MAG: Deoxyribodipyrimidine photo-lyase [Candidatus Thorarchaeota archaeon]
MIENTRIKRLNQNSIQDGEFILYWMQASQRPNYNHALEYAIELANRYEHPVVVFVGITDRYPDANLRSYSFMVDGLSEAQKSLLNRGIGLRLEVISPEVGAVEYAKKACLVVVDRGYLRHQREWRTYVADHIRCPLIQVETDVIVPVEVSSPKEEYTAGTFRPKINRVLDEYLVPLEPTSLEHTGPTILDEKSNQTPACILKELNIARTVPPIEWLEPGFDAALKQFEYFLENDLDSFEELRNDPAENNLSHMSPYLHFGQISPLYMALRVIDAESPGGPSFLEELIVRRELSMNFVYYNEHYDSLECLPSWAQSTLSSHATDEREYIYSVEEFEKAQTHDPYWNAAQMEMVHLGKMHGYMRMYWGKKILEWSSSPQEAYQIAIYLNNKYELDGRDPNGYTGVAWCFGKHDRAWKERPIYGKVRYMNARGLERKFDIERYVQRVPTIH